MHSGNLLRRVTNNESSNRDDPHQRPTTDQNPSSKSTAIRAAAVQGLNTKQKMSILPRSSNYKRLDTEGGRMRRFGWKKFAVGAVAIIGLVWLFGPRERREQVLGGMKGSSEYHTSTRLSVVLSGGVCVLQRGHGQVLRMWTMILYHLHLSHL